MSRPNHYAVVREALATYGEMTATEIAGRTGAHAQTISKTCSKMHHKGLLRRREGRGVKTSGVGGVTHIRNWLYSLPEEVTVHVKPRLVLGPKWGYLPGRGLRI